MKKMVKCRLFEKDTLCKVMKGKKTKPQMYRTAPGEEPVYLFFENMCTDHACMLIKKRKKYTRKLPKNDTILQM
jgi:hypothetical protein